MPKKRRVLLDMVELGQKGGRARAEAMTPQQRAKSARRAARARWERSKTSSRSAA